MKKSLLALAVLGAFTGIASAQTSVTIYGVADVGITREDNGVSTTNRLDSGNQSGSRLGFRGNEDLGGGLSAQFVLEQGFNIDTGSVGNASRGAFNRQAFVGLTGNFGQLRLGRQKTVMYDTLDAIDPFHIANAGGIDRLFAKNTGAALGGAAGTITTTSTTVGGGASRSDNTIAYFTPNVSGFTGQVTYAFGEVPGSNKSNRQYGLSLNYAAGPLYLTADYLNVNNTQTLTVGDDRAKTTLLGGTYDFGVVKAHAGYAIEKGFGITNNRDYMVGATVPFGASAVQLDYIKKSDKSSANNQGAKQYGLGYTYALSKRTNFYSSYTHTQQDAGANYVGVIGQTDKVLNAGVRHTF